jgi:hypothetical protein
MNSDRIRMETDLNVTIYHILIRIWIRIRKQVHRPCKNEKEGAASMQKIGGHKNRTRVGMIESSVADQLEHQREFNGGDKERYLI